MTIYTRIEPAPLAEGGTGSKQSIARGFGSASGTYDGASRLQKVMGDAMMAEFTGKFAPETILDLGCGTGWFTRKLAQHYPRARVTGADLAPGMLAEASRLSPKGLRWLQADAEQLPLPDNSTDLVFSNLMIQWSNRPDAILAECRRVLKPGGRLMVSTLLDGTLAELKQAWAEADPGQPHVNRFTRCADWQQLSSQQLFGSTLKTATLTLPYDSPMALNRELKQLGAVFKGEERRRTITAPGRFKAMAAAYPETGNGQIIASYQAGWLYWLKCT
ncbi:malonyl-[acyl-carrier protein] O-methyltransferase BioC [Marinobacter fuscus]|uniref:Malonyl-[acyl-carrier protein] O-methyltransferase n=1 Tax=Marinobacter fuscus TaxID=2109942 RepID=A0A2T1K776_9GAMM|nr:malonyl-ACP O-methyltransferase BioC [Marinobacter fuscus]PSF06011.1 malonyl-[acyl-carrier protein] O-methyltransferase BioC [Marinobacter fuscus]